MENSTRFFHVAHPHPYPLGLVKILESQRLPSHWEGGFFSLSHPGIHVTRVQLRILVQVILVRLDPVAQKLMPSCENWNLLQNWEAWYSWNQLSKYITETIFFQTKHLLCMFSGEVVQSSLFRIPQNSLFPILEKSSKVEEILFFLKPYSSQEA